MQGIGYLSNLDTMLKFLKSKQKMDGHHDHLAAPLTVGFLDYPLVKHSTKLILNHIVLVFR